MFTLAALSEEEKDELYLAIGYTDDTSHPVYSDKVLMILLTLCTQIRYR